MAFVSRFGVRFLSALTHPFRGRVQQSRAHTSLTTTSLQKFTSDVPRFGGIATMLRLPMEKDNLRNLDVCFVGIPLDTGTSFRSGTRHGPRQVRNESSILRPYNINGAAPFDSLRVADIGDIAVNPYNLPKAVEDITKAYRMILTDECIPLTLGGDHTITYPILRAIREKHGPVGLVHIDAHSDTHDTMFGEKIAHGTPFRRAVEEGLLDTQRVVQIGLRGTAHTPNDYQWAKEQGFRMIRAEECWYKSLVPLMESIREQMGDRPVYLSFDIDGIDPGFCPGTGTPEIGGLTVIQAIEIVRGCRGLDIIGGDLVEVNPLFDPHGTTAITAANLLFEMLCVLPGVKYHH